MSIRRISENTIEQIGTAYMAGMNQRVSLHFETIIELRLTMAESIARIAEGDETSDRGSREEIGYGARARHFLCAALYSPEGEIEMIYGDPVEPSHPGPFLDSLRNGERKAASAFDSSGNGVILFGVPCAYPMSDGEDSLAMIVGLSSKYMGEEASACIDRLTAAMNENKDYSVILKSGQSRRHLYCTALPYCEWYLVMVLPYGELDQAISNMGSRWLAIVYISSFAVIAMLLYIFFRYLKVFRNQVSELKHMNAEMDEARQDAEHANTAKQEFLSSMSHNIRTPMNATIGMTSLAADNTRVRKTEGSGLGMAITKYIVDAMGGTISVRSEQGKGSFALRSLRSPPWGITTPSLWMCVCLLWTAIKLPRRSAGWNVRTRIFPLSP